MQPHHCNKAGGAHEGVMAACKIRLALPPLSASHRCPCTCPYLAATTTTSQAMAACTLSRQLRAGTMWRQHEGRRWRPQAGLRSQTLAQIVLALACYIRQNASAGARRARLWGFPCARALAAGPRRVRQRARCERREQARLRENKRLAAPPRRQRRPTLRPGARLPWLPSLSLAGALASLAPAT